MFIKEIELKKYRILEDISIKLEKKQNNLVYPIISINGGGKSSLLQIIFAFLHCPFTPERHKYLKTMLKEFDVSNDESVLIKFNLAYKQKNILLEFVQYKDGYKNLYFESILNERDLQATKEQNDKLRSDLEILERLRNDFANSRVSKVLLFRELGRIIGAEETERLEKLDSKSFLEQILVVQEELASKLHSDDFRLTHNLPNAKAERKKLFDELDKVNLKYAFHFNNNENILLYKTNVETATLIELSEKVYLATPLTQILHFLEDDSIKNLFSSEKYLYSSYEAILNECKKDLIGLFNYDFSTIELILKVFKKARDQDFKKALDTGKYGNQIQTIKDELSSMFSGKSISIDGDFEGVSFKLEKGDKLLTPKDLSHGELKKLSIYIWLKAIVENDSLILMDEVDMGLHPIWQHELYSDIQNWSNGSQFLLATHSPQIISRSFYKNLVVLKYTETGATSEQFIEAPLESDLNTIVKTIMGGEYLPKELLILRKQYRSLFEEDKLNTLEAEKVKEEILMYESENSSFFQDIKFQMELNK